MEKVGIFLSWSGDSSHGVAQALRTWLPDVIQAVEPWISSEDIEKGSRWTTSLAEQLETTSIGIICLTPDNLDSPWLLFEAGALSKRVSEARVCTLLHKVRKADLRPPLSLFQATETTKEDFRKLVQMVNSTLRESGLAPDQCNRVFETWWPQLEAELTRITLTPASGSRTVRSPAELLEEVLDSIRRLERRAPTRGSGELIAVSSHELKVMFNAILGYTEVLQMEVVGELNDKQQELLGRIRRAGERGVDFVNGLLAKAWSEGGIDDLVAKVTLREETRQ